MIVNICLGSSCEHPRRKLTNALGDVREGVLEGLLSAEAQRIRNRPMGATHSGKFLMGVVTHGHYEVPLLRHLVQPARRKVSEIYAVATGYLDGPPGDAVRGMCSGRHRRDFTGVLPESSGQLGPGTVAGADEEYAAGAVFSPWQQALQGAGGKPHVAAAPVRFGTVAAYQPGLLQGAEMVGQQIRGHSQLCLQLRRGEVASGQQLHDAEARRVREGGMFGYALVKPVCCLNVH